MVGEVGVEPTISEDNGFTVHRVCRFATLPVAGVDGFEPSAAGVKVLCLTAWRHPKMDYVFLVQCLQGASLLRRLLFLLQ